jgi:hypothetical protein
MMDLSAGYEDRCEARDAAPLWPETLAAAAPPGVCALT